MPAPRFASTNRKRMVILAFALVAILGLILSRRPPVKAEAQILPMPEQLPSYPSHPLDRLLPMKWGWLWKIRYAILGYNPSIHLSPILTDLSETPQDVLAFLLPASPPLAQTNGTQVWILPPDEFRALQRRLQVASNASEMGTCRLTTGPWVQANLFSGSQVMVAGTQRPFGLNANIYTRLKGKAIDLTALFTVSKAITNPPAVDFKPGDAEVITIQTNLSFAGRFVVPESNGVFVLNSSRFPTGHQRAAILITPQVEPYQKK